MNTTARLLLTETLARLRAEAGVGAGEPVPRLRRDQFEKASKERFQAEAGCVVVGR